VILFLQIFQSFPIKLGVNNLFIVPSVLYSIVHTFSKVTSAGETGKFQDMENTEGFCM
jgi:hypothetical protein